jgi:hypothetical protein
VFRLLTEADLLLLWDWLNRPHVAVRWGGPVRSPWSRCKSSIDPDSTAEPSPPTSHIWTAFPWASSSPTGLRRYLTNGPMSATQASWASTGFSPIVID